MNSDRSSPSGPRWTSSALVLAGTLLLGLGCADLPAAQPLWLGRLRSCSSSPAPHPRGRARRAKADPSAAMPPPSAADPQPPIPEAGVPDPLAGLTTAQICASDTLLLLKYPFDDLQRGTCSEVCCTVDPNHRCCGLDWPFSDVPPCRAWGVLRNGIYSRYGFPFQEEPWKDQFAAAPYYRRREDFDPGWLTPVARANVVRLKQLEQAGVSCTP